MKKKAQQLEFKKVQILNLDQMLKITGGQGGQGNGDENGEDDFTKSLSTRHCGLDAENGN
jgi:hypothetical protein